MEKALRAAEAVEEKEVVGLLQALVRIPSHYPGPGEAGVAAFLAEYLRGRGLRPFLQEAAPGRPNLVADLGEGEGGLILEGHTDVVTPGDEARWTYPPYGAVVEGGRLYGRGACDMKGGLAALVGALLAVKRALGPLKRPLRLAALADEEGMMLGVKAFLRAGLAQGFRGAVVAEPEEMEVCLWQKGALRLRLLFPGRMAHGAMPYAGENPIPKAARFVLELKASEERLHRAFPHPFLGPPYLTPTRFLASAGEGQLNVLPDRAEVALDVRTVPGVDHAGLVAEIGALAGVGVEVLEDRPPVETPREDPLVQAAEEALRLLGLPVRHGGVPGATDGTFLRAWGGLPVVVMGPGRKTLPHQVDEWVEVEEVVRAARVYAALAVLYLE
ncbi:acetylornithine deacetylase or succinyl-diaminopimelate desuccinylase (plasmid) [Thermus oshimai JL-2]|uniref:Probable succinyl-diaminopimelate desuccinylase n=1 Tax=Thermus oshimai JL-2 TaxID=751945 RepID=K7R298_THEOS|nr:M20 family metallopeptidase [Thermus oshimai]AFV77425.1 acetylornithine deacetylase or succinyl-diaminopimelate desuccinylase [Thermus oshimai JL-2]